MRARRTRYRQYAKITSATKNTLEITTVSNTYEDIGVLVKLEGVDIVVSTIAYDGSIALP